VAGRIYHVEMMLEEYISFWCFQTCLHQKSLKKKVKMLAQTMKWLQVKETGPCHGPDAEWIPELNPVMSGHIPFGLVTTAPIKSPMFFF
jgi:hypothetical protein